MLRATRESKNQSSPLPSKTPVGQNREVNETDRLIYAYFDAFNRGDEEGLLGLLADDVIHEINEGPRKLESILFELFGPG